MTYEQPVKGLFDLWRAGGVDQLTSYNACTRSIQNVIARATQDGCRLKAYGGAWSFSKAPATDGYLINTKPLNYTFEIRGSALSPSYDRTKGLTPFLAQCGTQVKELNERLRRRNLSLRTSGASNGQTIAGAMSTGTHGSAFKFGAVQDFVVGLHVIVSPTDHVWLERASYPVVSDSFVRALGTRRVPNDELFNAALVSFGSFGVIHGVMIEAEPVFLLEASRKAVPFDATFQSVLGTLDFTKLNLPNGSSDLYHFQVVLNPYDVQRRAHMTLMYKRPFRSDYPRVESRRGGFGPGDDAPSFLGTITDLFESATPALVNAIMGNAYASYDSKWGTLGEIFTSTDTRGRVSSTAIGVPLERASEAFSTLLSLHDSDPTFPGVYALRYVRESSALLGFTRFARTCVIEADGVQGKHTTDFYGRLWNRFRELDIPYTFHWGKEAQLSPDLVRRMYGDNVDRWLLARRQLVPEQQQQVFSSEFLQTCGLDV